jgi:GTP cyclohydrolase I
MSKLRQLQGAGVIESGGSSRARRSAGGAVSAGQAPPASPDPSERHLHALPGRAAVDLDAAEAAARGLLTALGADLETEGLRETPRRIAYAYAELLTPMPFNATTFPNDEGYDELVVVRDIPFQSLCMHHMLPFHGIAHVAYLPGERIIGLSKLGRVVDLFARDLQVQERLTTQVADWLDAELSPRGVGVIIEAEHLCMSLRGVQKAGSRTVTSALRGSIKDDPRTRQEFLSLVHGRPLS